MSSLGANVSVHQHPPPADRRVWLRSPCLPKGVGVPGFAFDNTGLVTLSFFRPDPIYQLNGVLATQAVMLAQSAADWVLHRPELVFEAHRLIRSDLCLVCGYLEWKRPQDGVFLAASPSDLTLELALVNAIGARPQALPHLRFLQQHTLMPLSNMGKSGQLPALRGYTLPSSGYVARWNWLRLRRWIDRVLNDWRATRQNLYRIPIYLRRRLNGQRS